MFNQNRHDHAIDELLQFWGQGRFRLALASIELDYLGHFFSCDYLHVFAVKRANIAASVITEQVSIVWWARLFPFLPRSSATAPKHLATCAVRFEPQIKDPLELDQGCPFFP